MIHTKCFQSRGVASRIILVLLAPLMLSGIGLIPQKILGINESDHPRFESHHSFRSIERMIHRNPDWLVLGRDFHPSRSNWALVIWHDGPLHPGLVDPDELLVLEHLDVSEAIVATMRVASAPPTSPVASTVDHRARTLAADPHVAQPLAVQQRGVPPAGVITPLAVRRDWRDQRPFGVVGDAGERGAVLNQQLHPVRQADRSDEEDRRLSGSRKAGYQHLR